MGTDREREEKVADLFIFRIIFNYYTISSINQ